MADDLGGDALAHLAFGLRIDRQREIRVGFYVDKTRRDGEPFGVDDFFRAIGAARPDHSNAAVRDGEIAGDAGTAGAVEQSATADQDVVHAFVIPDCRASGKSGIHIR